jgi:hypothetical protein
MSDVWVLGQLVQEFENLDNRLIGGLDALSFAEKEPDCIDVCNCVVRKDKRPQFLPARIC